MSQHDVCEFLSRNRRDWYTARDIICRLELSTGSITNSLKRLRETNQINHRVKRVNESSNRSVFQYSYKQ